MAGTPEAPYPLLAQSVGRISLRHRLERSPPVAARHAGPRQCTDARRPLVSLPLDPPHRSALVWIWMGKSTLRNRVFGNIPLPAVGSKTFSATASPDRRDLAPALADFPDHVGSGLDQNPGRSVLA